MAIQYKRLKINNLYINNMKSYLRFLGRNRLYNNEIPIFAVTGGICGAMDFMGTPMFTQDYCGLRDKHLHPKEWVNIDDVHNYCFYTIEFH